MKNALLYVLICGLLISLIAESREKLVIGATPVPHAEILEQVKPELRQKGIDLEIKVFTDYVTPDIALGNGSLDANYFQHLPYLDDFNSARKDSLVSAGSIHYEPLLAYSAGIRKLDELKDGDRIAIPNDVTNEARALILLQDNGIIRLKDSSNLRSTVNNIQKYYVKVNIVELDAAQLTRAIKGVTVAIINGNYAIDAKFAITDAIAHENALSVSAKTYANIIAVRKGDENRAAIKALIAALKSEKTRTYIKKKYLGAVLPAE